MPSQETILNTLKLIYWTFYSLFIFTFVQYIHVHTYFKESNTSTNQLITKITCLPNSNFSLPTVTMTGIYGYLWFFSVLVIIYYFKCERGRFLYSLHPTPVYPSHLQPSNVLKGFVTCYPKICVIYSQLKESEKCRCRKNSWPSPEAGHKTLEWEVPSLGPEERGIDLLISEGEGPREESEQTGLAKFPSASHTYLIPFVLSYLSTTFHPSSNLA